MDISEHRVSASEEGSASAVALGIIILICALSCGGLLFLHALMNFERKQRTESEIKYYLVEKAKEIASEILKDETPDSDCPGDRIWTKITEGGFGDVEITLSDISSRLNPNWVRKNLLDNTSLKGLFLPTGNSESLQVFRVEKDLGTRVEQIYNSFFDFKTYPDYFTGYSWANINTTDEFVLEKIFKLCTGDTYAAEVFHTAVQQKLMQLGLFKTEELEYLFGGYYKDVYPIINAEPSMNVHFIPGLILSEIISYPAFEIDQPEKALGMVLSMREQREINPNELKGIIGSDQNNRVYQYLGTRTWFWDITVRKEKNAFRGIFAIFPGEERKGIFVEEWYINE